VRSTNNAPRRHVVLATSRQWTGGGEKQEKTEWHRVICWNKQAPAGGSGGEVHEEGDGSTQGRVEYRPEIGEADPYTTEIIRAGMLLLSFAEAGEGPAISAAKAARKVEPRGEASGSLDAFPGGPG